jgi:hypothetical protein
MKKLSVTATKEINGEKKQATVEFEVGDNVEESIKMFGAEVVNSGFIADAVIDLQAFLRRRIEKGEDQAVIAQAATGWKPGVKMPRVSDPVGALMAKFPTMTKEEQAAIINQLKARAAGKTAAA